MFERMFSREMEEGRQRHGGHGHHCGDKRFRGRHGEGEREFSGRGFGGREWGGRFRGRVFDTGDLRFVILRLIAEKPSYGYEIIKGIEERVGGGTKKLHTITDEGKAALEANKPAVDALFERMERAGTAFGRGRAPQIM